MELALGRFQGNNLGTTDSLTNRSRSTTEHNLNLSNCLFRHINTGTFTNATRHSHHSGLTTSGTGTTIVISDTTDCRNDTINSGTWHAVDIIG